MGSSRTRDRTCVLCIGRQSLNYCATREVLGKLFLIVRFLDLSSGSCWARAVRFRFTENFRLELVLWILWLLIYITMCPVCLCLLCCAVEENHSVEHTHRSYKPVKGLRTSHPKTWQVGLELKTLEAQKMQEELFTSPSTAWKNFNRRPGSERVIARDNFYLNELSLCQGKHLITKHVLFSLSCELTLLPFEAPQPYPIP